MKFSLRLLHANDVKAHRIPEWERQISPAGLIRAVQTAEQLGYSKICCPEHFVISADHRDLTGDHHLHAVTSLALVAGVTSQVRLASQITLLPLVHAIAQAKMWATLDWLSNGRAVLLAGVGWHQEEYEMLGVDFHQRGALCDEYVAAMLELWSSDNPTFEGKYVSFRDVGASPKPVRGTIPLWFGGDAPGVLRRIAKWGSGWSPHQTPPEAIPETLDRIRQHREYGGQPLEVAWSLTMLRIGEAHVIKDDARSEAATEASKLVDQIGWMSSLGVTETFLPRPSHRDFEEYLDWLRWVSEEVMPHTRS